MNKQNIFIPELKHFRSYDNCIIYLLYNVKDEIKETYIGVCSHTEYLQKKVISDLKQKCNLEKYKEDMEKYRELFFSNKEDLKIMILENVKVSSIYKLQDIMLEWYIKKLPLNVENKWYKEYYENKEI